MSKSPDAFRTISEVADWLGIQAHVLRFWESKFNQVKPVKRAGGRRYYRPVDMLLLGGIKKLLHDDGLTIKGVQKMLREQGVEHVSEGSRPLDSPARDDLGAPGTLPRVVRIKSRVAPPPAADFDLTTDPDAGPEPAPEPTPESPPVPVEASAPAAPEDVSDSSANSTPETEIDDSPEPQAAEDTGDVDPVSPPDQPVESAPAQPSLPSFLHRPPPPETPDAEAPEPAPEPVTASAPRPTPRLVDIADPPPEDEIPYRPGPLGRLVRIHGLSPNQAAEIAPVVADLRALFDRLSGHPPA